MDKRKRGKEEKRIKGLRGKKLVCALGILCAGFFAGGASWGSEAHDSPADEAHHGADEGHHSKHHLALLLGMAYEETSDGHHESGNMAGLEYVYSINHRWGIGAALEGEVFGDEQNRNAVLAVPLSHFRGNWRLFAGPGVELRKDDETELLLRLGVGYSFHVNERFSITPEALVDFVETGTNVYVVSIAFGLSL